MPVPGPPPTGVTLRTRLQGSTRALRDFFVGADVTFTTAAVPYCLAAMVLFTRHPLKTNFIFDEQEALLANPYVRSAADPHTSVRWLDAFHRDFWGLPADRSIGSYRPIPDLVWRVLWKLGARDQTPFLDHWVNVLLHGVNGALLALLVQKVTRDRALAWLSGAAFVGCAVLTEAVSGVVGIADVLGGFGVLLSLLALALPIAWLPLGVFAGTLFGLYSKESALSVVPLVPLAAFLTAPLLAPPGAGRSRRALRTLLATLATASAFAFYVEARRRMFPAPAVPALSAVANAGKPWAERVFAALLRWYAQPALPRDPLNNPLVQADFPHRVAGALRVYARGLGQVLFPWHLSGDYSSPQEPVPASLVFPESVIGGLAMALPVLASALLSALAFREQRRRAKDAVDLGDGAEAAPSPNVQVGGGTLRSRGVAPPDVRPVLALALAWIVVSYFPVSNLPVLLPTVRAERFWYFPALGTSVLLAFAFVSLVRWARITRLALASVAFVWCFFGCQAVFARLHANDYTDDLVFWDATRRAVPRSAKAHLNYSVMQGARGNLETRAASNRVALTLAPDWPMANVYLGDTLCRLHRPREGMPYYLHGFDLASADTPLVALGLQCLWDEHALDAGAPARDELEQLAGKHPGSWLEFLVRDTLDNGAKNNGVDPKYRPRGYNEGPKQE